MLGRVFYWGAHMHKHRGFPSRLKGTDFHFTLRRENKNGATPLVARERYKDRRPADRKADEGFLIALVEYFGEEPFERGNLDAGRLSWFLGREVKALEPFDPTSYETLLQLDSDEIMRSYPHLFDKIEGQDD